MMRRLLPRASVLLWLLPAAVQARAQDPHPAPAAASPAPAATPTAPAPATAPTAPAATAPTISAPEPAPASPASAPATPAAPSSAGSAPAAPPVRKPAHAAARHRRATVASTALPAPGEEPALESSDPSIDRHEPPRVPAAPIPTISAWLGVGNVWIPSEGFDSFSNDDALTGFDAGAAVSLANAAGLDVAAVAGIGIAGSDERYRGEETSLALTRFALGPELRGSLLDRLYWHGRLSPTLTRVSAEMAESSSGATLSDTRWVWGAEAALGLELRFAEAATSLPRALGFFVRVEAGYAWSPSSALTLEAASGAPVRTVPLELGELSLAGPLLRANVGIGF